MHDELNSLKLDLASIQKEKEALSLKNRNLHLELSNMTKAQGSLYRFQEKMERQKTIYEQIAEIGHQFNQSLDFQVVTTAIERFVTDHLNFERCLILLRDPELGKMTVVSQAGYYLQAKSDISSLTLSGTEAGLVPLCEGGRCLRVSQGDPSALAETFFLGECAIYSLGVEAPGQLRGLLVVGNSQEHLTFHLRVTEDAEMDALFANITGQIVAAKNAVVFMQTIQQESEQIRRLLNNMKQAVFSTNASAQIVEPVSKSAGEIFSTELVNQSVFTTLFKGVPKDSEEHARIDSVFQTVFGEGSLQWTLMEDNLPQRVIYPVEGTEKILKIVYAPIWDEDDNLEKIMLVIEDITELEKLESQIQEKQAGIRVIQEIAANDRSTLNASFFARTHTLFERCETLLAQLTEGVIGELMRNLHTIKGNARMYGFSSISSAIHQGESRLLELKGAGLQGSAAKNSVAKNMEQILAEIRTEIERYGTIAHKVFGIANSFSQVTSENSEGSLEGSLNRAAGPRVLEVLEDHILALGRVLSEVEAGRTPLSDARRALSRISDIPVRPELLKFKGMVQEISASLGKKINFEVPPADINFNRPRLHQLQDAMVHLIRNAIDHGIESPQERLAAHKNEVGLIRLHCLDHGDGLKFTLEDDGRGIDPEKIAASALKKGFISAAELENLSAQEKINLIFLPGFSSRDEATELSGRGVGLDFVSQTLQQLYAPLKIESEVGRGTRFIIHISSSDTERELGMEAKP